MPSTARPQPPKQLGMTPRRPNKSRSPTADTDSCGMDNERQKSRSEGVKLRGYGRILRMRRRRVAPLIGSLAVRAHVTAARSHSASTTGLVRRATQPAPVITSPLKGGHQ
jgi:hypothetical protein